MAASEVFLVFSNLLSGFNPALLVCGSPLVALCIQSRPVLRVIVFELQVTTSVAPELLGWNKLSQILVELHLVLGDGVDEGRDELEESVDVPGACKARVSTEMLLAQRAKMDSQSLMHAFPRRSGL